MIIIIYNILYLNFNYIYYNLIIMDNYKYFIFIKKNKLINIYNYKIICKYVLRVIIYNLNKYFKTFVKIREK